MKVIDIANVFIHLANSESEGSITNLKLNKLLYFAQGWSLALRDKALFNEDIQAWKFGPVIPLIYRSFNVCGSMPIQHTVGEYDESKIKSEDIELLLDVYREYGKYTSVALVEFTHRPNTPWSNYYVETVPDIVIPQESIKNYFKQLPKLHTFRLPDLSKYIMDVKRTSNGSIIMSDDDWD